MKTILCITAVAGCFAVAGAKELVTEQSYESYNEESFVQDKNGVVKKEASAKNVEEAKNGKIIKAEHTAEAKLAVDWKTSKFESSDYEFLKQIMNGQDDFVLDVSGNKNADDKVIDRLIREEMLKNVTKLNLRNSGITSKGIANITSLKNFGKLKEVNVSGIYISPEEAKIFAKDLANSTIESFFLDKSMISKKLQDELVAITTKIKFV